MAGVSWPEPSDISFCSTITLVFRYPLLLSAFILSQPSDNQNPWINWGGGLDTPGRIWSGELCQRPVQCWHRGYTRSAAADRSSILDKHILSFFLSFLSRIFLFLISFNTFERNKAKQSLREFLSSSSWEQKKKKKITEKYDLLSIHRFQIEFRGRNRIEMIECQSIVVGDETRRGWRRSASFSVFRKDLWPPCYWRVYHRHLPPPFSLPPPLALFLTLNPRFCLQFEPGHRGGGFEQIIAFSIQFPRSFIISRVYLSRI